MINISVERPDDTETIPYYHQILYLESYSQAVSWPWVMVFASCIIKINLYNMFCSIASTSHLLDSQVFSFCNDSTICEEVSIFFSIILYHPSEMLCIYMRMIFSKLP